MASKTHDPFPLASETPYGGSAGGTVDDSAGASGSSEGAVNISKSAIIAIIVVVSVVGALGIASAVLFYLTKKKEWKLRQKVRRSAKRVKTALTPRRSEFPRSVKESTSGNGRSMRDGRVRLDDVPPTPRLRPEDVEKGMGVAARVGSAGSEGKSDNKRWFKK